MKKIILAASVAAFALASCGGIDYDKTSSGLVYKIFPSKSSDSLLKAGDYIKYNVVFYLSDRSGKPDSLLSGAPSAMPQYFQVDTSKRIEYSFMEIMTKLKTGDSAVVLLSTDSLKKRNAINPNDSIVFIKGSNVQCRVKIIQTFKDEKAVMADYQKETKAEEEREVKSVEQYMASKGVKGIKTKNGAYVVIDNPGDASMKADSGKVASVKYRGYLMSDTSKVFDTNMDSSKGHTDPYEVAVGRGGVIAGWTECLPYFGKGTSGKILIPSFLAWGPQGSPPDIPANANVIFDIRIVDIKDAPPPAKPQMLDGRQMPQEEPGQ